MFHLTGPERHVYDQVLNEARDDVPSDFWQAAVGLMRGLACVRYVAEERQQVEPVEALDTVLPDDKLAELRLLPWKQAHTLSLLDIYLQVWPGQPVPVETGEPSCPQTIRRAVQRHRQRASELRFFMPNGFVSNGPYQRACSAVPSLR
jgi:hypothetical protein